VRCQLEPQIRRCTAARLVPVAAPIAGVVPGFISLPVAVIAVAIIALSVVLLIAILWVEGTERRGGHNQCQPNRHGNCLFSQVEGHAWFRCREPFSNTVNFCK
jgi:hypothetical protein